MSGEQLYADDLVVGFSFVGEEKNLTEAMFKQFAELTGDDHPIHYDSAYAAGTRFGKPVAHGLLLTGLAALGATSLSQRLEAAMVALIEQSATFLGPAFVGDRLQASYAVVGNVAGAASKSARVELEITMTKLSGEMVFKGRQVYLLRRRLAL